MAKTKVEWAIVEHVREIRKAKKKTQRNIAAFLKVTPGYIGQIETETSPSMYSYDQLNHIAAKLGCSLKDFMPEKPL